MSEIDCYEHECIGMVHCPSDYWPPPGWLAPGQIIPDEEKYIPLYLMHEDALDDNGADFVAKRGDLLIGGGSGEARAFWIAMPEALILYTREDWENWLSPDGYNTISEFHDACIYHPYWYLDDAFIFGSGYAKLGWNPHKVSLGVWLVEHILAFVVRDYPQLWGHLRGERELEADGSICRLPTEEEKAFW